MFRRKKQRPPDRPFEHDESCPIVRADPGYQGLYGTKSRLAAGGGSANAAPRAGAPPTSTIAFGTTRTMRPPSATWATASTGTRPIMLSSGSS